MERISTMIKGKDRHRVSRRHFNPRVSPLECRVVLSSFEASLLPGGGAYGTDPVAGLTHYQDGQIVNAHLNGVAISDIAVGKTREGTDDVFVQAVGTDEIYRYTASTGFVDQHGQLSTVVSAPNGGAYGIAGGVLFRYQEGQGWSKIGGSGIVNIDVGQTPQGADEVFLTNTSNEVYIWTAATGGVDQHGQLTSIDATAGGGAYGIGGKGQVYHYTYGVGWSQTPLTGITTLSVGSDQQGKEVVFALGQGGEVYQYSSSGGVIDLRAQLNSVVATTNGVVYGTGLTGTLYRFQVGGQFTGLGGNAFDAIEVGQDSSGTNEVFALATVIENGVSVGTVSEYRPSTGLRPIAN
jgi:hypothetical protein